MRKRYILLKDTPELLKGAILEEKCDDGTQGFNCITSEHIKMEDQTNTSYTRQTVTRQPNWFEEVEMVYLTKKQMEKFNKLISSK